MRQFASFRLGTGVARGKWLGIWAFKKKKAGIWTTGWVAQTAKKMGEPNK